MSSAKARSRVASTMALPPNLITTMAPAKDSSQGRASISTSAFSSGVRASGVGVGMLMWCGPSGGVGTVLVDVVVGEVVGPDGGLRLTGVQVDDHVHLAARSQVQLGGVLVRPAAFADEQAVDAHVQLGGVERGDLLRHGADLGDDAAPVRAGDGPE